MPRVLLNTTVGEITCELYETVAPNAVENFKTHAANGYYDGVLFHRIIEDFMIQGGDPTGTGRGGESIWGRPFADECREDVVFDRPGLLAMANAGPGTNGSQFFITTAATPWLHMRHTLFGEVVSGMDTVRQLEAVKKDPDDRPVKAQKIESAKVLEP